jgi:hypothetical protein
VRAHYDRLRQRETRPLETMPAIDGLHEQVALVRVCGDEAA